MKNEIQIEDLIQALIKEKERGATRVILAGKASLYTLKNGNESNVIFTTENQM